MFGPAKVLLHPRTTTVCHRPKLVVFAAGLLKYLFWTAS